MLLGLLFAVLQRSGSLRITIMSVNLDSTAIDAIIQNQRQLGEAKIWKSDDKERMEWINHYARKDTFLKTNGYRLR